MPSKVAIVTGGSSGIGLAVCHALSKTPNKNWTIHILDLNPPSPAPPLPDCCKFHSCDVSNEAALGTLFSSIYTEHRRLDFVFANPGIGEKTYFYDQHEEQVEDTVESSSSNKENDKPPPLPVKGMHALVDINIKSVITTTYLADYYMRKSLREADKSIVMTASCGGLYPSNISPIYTGTKHAVVGFMRGIAPYFYQKSGIRVNAICPGVVRTGLMSSERWGLFPEEYFTPVQKVAEVVCMLVEGKDDGTGKLGIENEDKGHSSVLNGKAVEISGRNHYYRGPVSFADDNMAAVMGFTDNTKVA